MFSDEELLKFQEEQTKKEEEEKKQEGASAGQQEGFSDNLEAKQASNKRRAPKRRDKTKELNEVIE